MRSLGTMGVGQRPGARRRGGAWPGVLVVSGVVAVLLTASWWWSTTAAVTSAAEAALAAGRLSGLAAGLAVIALVMLAARIGPLDRAIGAERLYLWHARLGRYAIGMIVAHAILITAGYALMGRDGVGAVVASYLAGRDTRTAILAAALFLVVGAVSLVAVRRHLPYEVWHAIHLATYAAILLGLVHQVTQGAQLADQPVASALWVAACVVPVAVLLVNRLVRPLVMNLRHRFRLVAVVPETPGVHSLVIGGLDLDRIGAVAGQFVRVHAGLRFASNPYSLSAVPGGAGWRITVAVVGTHSRRLASLAPGTRLWLEGPMGGLVLDPRSVAPAVLIAGGTGIAPIRALAEAALVQRPNAPVVVLCRVRDAAKGLFRAEFAQLTAWANGRFGVYWWAGPRSLPGNRVDAAALTRLVPWIGSADVLVCGGPQFGEAVTQAVSHTGAASLRVESFGW